MRRFRVQTSRHRPPLASRLLHASFSPKKARKMGRVESKGALDTERAHERREEMDSVGPMSSIGALPSYRVSKSIDEQRAFLESITPFLGVKEKGDLELWYKITAKKLSDAGGHLLLQQYKGSIYNLLTTIYPNFKWDLRKFTRVPRNYWESLENQRRYLDELAEKLGIEKGGGAGWYQVSSQTLIDNGGAALLRKYDDSISSMLFAAYPDVDWNPVKFKRSPRNHWAVKEHQRIFMDELGKKLGMKEGEREGWYKVTNRTLIDNGGRAILRLYNDSISTVLENVFADYPWDRLKFKRAPNKFWTSLENQKVFMADLGRKLGFQDGDIDRWYKVSHKVFHDNGGSGLLALYKNSLPDLLTRVYPDHDWAIWKFERRPGQALNDPDSLKGLLAFVEKELDLQKPSDWYRVTQEQLASIGVGGIMTSKDYKLVDLLSQRYPNQKWDAALFSNRGYKKASQRWLFTLVAKIFQGELVFENHSPEGLDAMELDIYVPSARLGFEYQGQQHYEQLTAYGNSQDRMKLDEEKWLLSRKNGITLIAVPFWWQKNRGPLLAAILEQRPDLFLQGDSKSTSKPQLASYLEEARKSGSQS